MEAGRVAGDVPHGVLLSVTRFAPPAVQGAERATALRIRAPGLLYAPRATAAGRAARVRVRSAPTRAEHWRHCGVES